MGLGFSAAAGVALARAVEIHSVGTDAADRVEARAMAWERVFHGNPSGVDVAAAMHGGLLRFSRARGIRPLPGSSNRAQLLLAIGLTGVPSATRTMVEQVASERRARPTQVDSLIDRIGRLVEEGIEAAGAADAARLGAVFDRNQELLSELGVSTPAMDRMCAEARSAGALGAKLTGSGGGGAVIALAGFGPPGTENADLHGVADAVISRWRSLGWEAFSAAVGIRVDHDRTPELDHD
jgi:mevalonate kinase